MATVISQPGVRINGGEPVPCEVEIHQDVEVVRSLTATKPDPKWSFTDAQGHFHAWAATKKNSLPTLRGEEVEEPCPGGCDDPDCEGLTRTVYHCVICDEVVEPRHIPDYEAQEFGIQLPGRKSATVTVHGTGPLPPLEGEVSLLIDAGGEQLFGVARAVSQQVGSEGWTITYAPRSLEPRLT